MPRFKSIIFHHYSPKIKLFSKKMQNFQTLGDQPPDPMPPAQGRREPNVGPGTAQTWMGPLSSSNMM